MALQIVEATTGQIKQLAPLFDAYVWGGYANLGNYPPYFKKHQLYFSQGIMGDKQHPVLTRKDFMGAFENTRASKRCSAIVPRTQVPLPEASRT